MYNYYGDSMNIFKLFKDDKFDKMDVINILIMVMISSGVFGFIYEVLFYRIDLGYFVKRGSTYGPWVPIYVFGGLFIALATYKYKDNPLLVFSIGALVSGLLEYISGYVFDKFYNLKLWNYSNEIWNYGNINGYICLRSVLFFGFSSLILIYILIPIVIKIIKNNNKREVGIVSYLLLIMFILDMILYNIYH